FAVEGGLVQLRDRVRPAQVRVAFGIRCGIPRRGRDAVGVDVVGVPVVAVAVVADHHRWTRLAHDLHQLPGGVVEVRSPEHVGTLVRRRAHHARVSIAEQVQVQLAIAQHTNRALELLATDLAEPWPGLFRIEARIVDLALLTARAGDEVDTATLRDGTRDQAAGRERLVVRVGVDQQEAAGAIVFAGVGGTRAPRPAPQARLGWLGEVG